MHSNRTLMRFGPADSSQSTHLCVDSMWAASVLVALLLGGAAAADADAHVVKLRHAPGGRLLVPHGAHGVHADLSQVSPLPSRSSDDARARWIVWILLGRSAALSSPRVLCALLPTSRGRRN